MKMRGRTWRRVTALLGLVVLVVPLAASAHPGGWAPFFETNGQFAQPYPFVASGFAGLDIPQSDLGTETFSPHQPIHFKIDFRYLVVPKQLGPVDFTIDTGDGHQYHSTDITHSYDKPGSYIVKVNADITIQNANGIIEAVLINVVPHGGYKMPRPEALVEGKPVDKPAQVVDFDPGSPLHFDAHNSAPGSARIVSYQWDFGDGTTSNDIATTHSYNIQVADALVVLRTKDANGLYADTYFIVHDRHAGDPSFKPDLNITTRLNKLYLDTTTWLRANMARLGGVGRPLPFSTLALILVVTFFLGALHSLTPGHSKSLMAALLVGKKGSQRRDVFILAGAITATHTAVIYVLGFLFLVLDTSLTLSGILPVIERVNAVLVVMLGIYLLWRGIKAAWQALKHRQAHSHEHEHSHSHDGHSHGHSHHHAEITPDMSGWKLFAAGASGGMVPCVDALSLLVLAASLHAAAFGLIMVVFFSLGLAGSIVALGLVVVRTKHLLNLEDRFGGKIAVLAPLATGLFVLGLGLTLLAS